MTAFDAAHRLEDDLVRLTPLAPADRVALAEAASDPLIWEQHPAKDRYKPEVFDRYFDFLLDGGGTLVAREKSSGAVIGCSRYYVGPDAPEDIGIGFTFLIRRHWGGPMNWRMKTLMLDHAFQTFDRVWFHVADDNMRSRKGTEKLGVVLHQIAAFDLHGAHANWVCYRLDKAIWQDQKRKRAARD
ncbi:MAG: GNAT family N-acetyltransferase [Pseudomonadota bacterium]